MSEPKRPTPKASRLTTPGYGFEKAVSSPGERLPWSRVSELLVASRNYWIVTTRPEGRPHSTPVWGVWLEEAFYFETSRQSRKARNLTANPELVVHIESDEVAVIIEGTAEEIADSSLLARFAAAYNPKYDWRIEEYLSKPASVVYGLRPRVAFSFTEDIAETATRWRFRDD